MTHKPGVRLRGEARATAMDKAAQMYLAGCTIRSVARQIDRSYGATRLLLLEAGVRLRPKGGHLPKASA